MPRVMSQKTTQVARTITLFAIGAMTGTMNRSRAFRTLVATNPAV